VTCHQTKHEKKGRGTHKEKEYKMNNTTPRAVKWRDTKPVTILSSFESAHLVTSVERYDRSRKARIEIPCPKAVSTRNECVGGADLLSSLIALYLSCAQRSITTGFSFLLLT